MLQIIAIQTTMVIIFAFKAYLGIEVIEELFILYLKDMLIPKSEDYERIGYSKEKMTWANANEESIWRNFIENEYLYSTDNKLSRRFLDPAPFSKFGLELDNESPGRIGRYIGWQIVRAFMNNNSVSLQQMLNLPADEIFKKSNYKPAK